MLRTLGLVVTGIAVGAVLSVLVSGTLSDDVRRERDPVDVVTDVDRAAQSPSSELHALSERVAELQAEVAALTQRLEAVESSAPTAVNPAPADRARGVVSDAEIRAFADRLAAPQTSSRSADGQDSDQLVAQLVAAGFGYERAQWIKRHNDQQLMLLVEARYDAERRGDPLSSEQLAALEPDRALRKDIGDAEYERYLRALGREPSVNVMTVLESSPAARAGMHAGDRIVSYGGARVFDFREITPLTLQGTPGESVVVDLVRGGQPMQIVVPRGPLGVSLSSDGAAVRGAAQQ
jgi:hypothetical protein